MTFEPPEEALPSPDEQHVWYVVHARPRSEKKVVEFCDTRSVTAYLPTITKRHTYGKRVRHYDLPLFAGYLFIFATAMEAAVLRQNQRVARVLSVLDQTTLLTQLRYIKCALDSKETVELFPHLEAGMKVQVQQGPLKGVEGFIQQLKSKTRIILSIDFIQQAVAVEVDAAWLVPA